MAEAAPEKRVMPPFPAEESTAGGAVEAAVGASATAADAPCRGENLRRDEHLDVENMPEKAAGVNGEPAPLTPSP